MHIHSERTSDGVIFGEDLRALAARNPAVQLVERHTATEARIAPAELDALCPDWRERDAFACGPRGLLDGLDAHYTEHGLADHLTLERFEIALMGADPGDGGSVTIDGQAFEAPAGTPILVAGEDAGLALKSGCRMGICHRCVCTLQEGQARDLRTGELITEPGQDVQLCVSAAAGELVLTSPPATDHAQEHPMSVTPGAHLTKAQVDALGAELDALYEEVRADLGERDAAYIRKVVDAQHKLELGGRAAMLFSILPPFWLAGVRCSPARRSSPTWRSATT